MPFCCLRNELASAKLPAIVRMVVAEAVKEIYSLSSCWKVDTLSDAYLSLPSVQKVVTEYP